MSKLLVAVALLSGCSIALQSKPAKVAQSKDCSTTHAYWIADLVGVVAGSAAMAYAIANHSTDEGALAGGIGGVGAVLYGASAGNGYRWRGECVRGEPAHVASR